jgi:hypothetical protein
MNETHEHQEPPIHRGHEAKPGSQTPKPTGWQIVRHPILWAKQADAHKLTAWGTVGVAAITGALAVLAYWTLKSSEESTKRSERAYVFAAPNNAYNVKPGTGVLQGYVAIINSGKTFAKITDWEIGVNVLDQPYSPKSIESFGELKREPGNPVIWPGFPHVAFRSLRSLDNGDYQAIRGRTRAIYVFGFIKYKDVFGDPHQTVFCHMYFGPEMANNDFSTYLSTQVKYCTEHNDAD